MKFITLVLKQDINKLCPNPFLLPMPMSECHSERKTARHTMKEKNFEADELLV